MFTDDKPKEECGVFGIWDSQREDVAQDLYYGLLSLQHRGQEAAGMAVCSSTGPRGNIFLRKDSGLVTEIFNEKNLEELKGNIGIGHVRYSTQGGGGPINAQPFTCYYQKGTLGLVHNGNLVNAGELKQMLMNHGYIFQATTDTEVIQMLLAKMRSESRSIEEAVRRTVSYLEGAYALLVMSPRKLVAVRDPLGLKPLCIGKTETGWILSSESCALKSVGAEFVRDVLPGEIIRISRKGLESDTSLCGRRPAHCIFEYIYFARLDSKIDGVSVYDARFKGGQALAAAFPAEADLVTGVPESGLTAAAGYADRAGIPYVQAFYKNSYIGRSFIKPTQKERESAVHMKLSVLSDAVRDKRVILIDDSIVRGTTIAHLIRMLREAGALAVHVRICSPPFLYPCYYGTDVPDGSELIARRMTTEEICELIGADSLEFMRPRDLDEAVSSLPVCKACFDGNYPASVPQVN